MGASQSTTGATFDRTDRDEDVDIKVTSDLLNHLSESLSDQPPASADSPVPTSQTYMRYTQHDKEKEADADLMRENMDELLRQSRQEGFNEGRQVADSELEETAEKVRVQIAEIEVERLLEEEIKATEALSLSLTGFEVKHGLQTDKEKPCKDAEAKVTECYRSAKSAIACIDLVSDFTQCVDSTRRSSFQ
eukprot:CFRG0891T1